MYIFVYENNSYVPRMMCVHCVCVCALAYVWRGLKKNGSVRWWTLIRMLCRCIIIRPYVQRGGGVSVHLQVAEFESSLSNNTATQDRQKILMVSSEVSEL